MKNLFSLGNIVLHLNTNIRHTIVQTPNDLDLLENSVEPYYIYHATKIINSTRWVLCKSAFEDGRFKLLCKSTMFVVGDIVAMPGFGMCRYKITGVPGDARREYAYVYAEPPLMDMRFVTNQVDMETKFVRISE